MMRFLTWYAKALRIEPFSVTQELLPGNSLSCHKLKRNAILLRFSSEYVKTRLFLEAMNTEDVEILKNQIT